MKTPALPPRSDSSRNLLRVSSIVLVPFTSEQSSQLSHLRIHPTHAQRIPQHRLITRDNGSSEPRLQLSDDLRSANIRAAQKHPVRIRRRFSRRELQPLFGRDLNVVIAATQPQSPASHNLDARLAQKPNLVRMRLADVRAEE